ncbi:MAG: DUF1365 family protein [Candidatus Pelagibacterales bacterium]|tara:strand:+ start:2485 stop:3219 length:735 start_codon:yes stop_codon:yes gene_type:complete
MIKSYIFDGVVSHKRSFPKKHKFIYKYTSIYNKDIFNFKNETFNELGFKLLSYDFNSTFIKENIIYWFLSFIKKHDINKRCASIDLLKTPNSLKNSFNPVCFWFLKIDDKIIAYIAEVTNTFREKQTYYIHNNGNVIDNESWYYVSKIMYVSPFSEKIGKYKFMLKNLPKVEIKINQFNKNNNLEIMTSLRGEIRKTNSINFLVYFVMLSFNSFMVIPRIHLQALKLWLKKLRVHPHKGNGYAE